MRVVLLAAGCAGWLASGAATAQTIEGSSGAVRAAIARAEARLPKVPARIQVIDRTDATRLRPTLSNAAEGFVPDGSTTIYLIEQGDSLRHAVVEGGIFDYALALVIWHEMAHVEGANEIQAELREEALWEQYIVQGRVERTRGMAYLKLLMDRRREDLRERYNPGPH